jgi:type II secretory pathway pseudopilin PulG
VGKSLIFMDTQNTNNSSGFTLVELIVAAAMALTIIGVSLGALVNMEQLNKATDNKISEQARLKQALDFISRDIQEAKKVEITGTPIEAGFQAIFHVEHLDGSKTAYYSKAPSTEDIWKPPQIIYRRQLAPLGKSEPQDPEPYPLIDAISDAVPEQCPELGEDSISSEPAIGLKIVIPKPPKAVTRVMICLREVASKGVLEGSIRITPRAIAR